MKTIVVVMGVSGSGKTTVASLLAERLGCGFVDGDDLHPRENVEKMRSGRPLDDADRLPWLEAIAHRIDLWLERGESGVVTCSALKRNYREIIFGQRPDTNLVYLRGVPALIHGRLMARTAHFMPAGLLNSQFATMQEPAEDERPIVVDIEALPSLIVDEIVRRLALRADLAVPVKRGIAARIVRERDR
ncbi:gluconokinase [Reyranella sp.]|uniref:gluconokinase n=1 Tax=Reyranella sp. TaxID=1929291 RepID=UPI0040351824